MLKVLCRYRFYATVLLVFIVNLLSAAPTDKSTATNQQARDQFDQNVSHLPALIERTVVVTNVLHAGEFPLKYVGIAAHSISLQLSGGNNILPRYAAPLLSSPITDFLFPFHLHW